MDELFGACIKNTSPFGGGPRPWTQVRNAGKLPNGAPAVDMYAEVAEWVTAQMERAPFATQGCHSAVCFQLLLVKLR